MKKIATKFILATASVFIAGAVMAQTDTTKPPIPDTTSIPTDTIPTDTSSVARIHTGNTTSLAAKIGQFNGSFYAIAGRELLNSSKNQYELKPEEETGV